MKVLPYRALAAATGKEQSDDNPKTRNTLLPRFHDAVVNPDTGTRYAEVKKCFYHSLPQGKHHRFQTQP
jgi:hypothetical protein